MIGRNELCPCGSGKKYKKCCLQKNQLVEFTRNKILYAKGLYKNMENKIYEYSKTSSFYSDREECGKGFHISQESNSKIDKLYSTYFMYDYRNNKGNTIIKMFIDDNKLTLSKNQITLLSAMLKANISIFKIENIGITKSIIRDYFNDNKIVVEDIDAFKNLNVGESIIVRVVNVQGMNILVDECIKVSDKNLKIILDNVKQLYKSNSKKSKSIKEFVIYNSEIIYKFGQQILLNNKSHISNPLNTQVKNEIVSKDSNNSDVNIYDALRHNMEKKYLQKGLDLWKEFIKSNKSIKGSENGWAAAIEYYIKKDAGEIITQAQVSEKYEISPRTLGKRYKELRAS
ncbi:SEC-C domain-containing protein [Terrisporobacter glycolicus]|nr:SEC-C domain-containing protein [Terrisporobacter glycolicus]